MTAIDDLVLTLLRGTRDGTVQWEQADPRGRAFLARRPSGTVVVEGPPSLSSPFPATISYADGPPGLRLSVKNEQGKTVEEVDAPVGTLPIISGLQPPAVRELPALFVAAREQVTKATSVVKTLEAEFRTPDE